MKAICFQCEKELPKIEQSMEELIKLPLPLFCSNSCADNFPDNGTTEFEKRFDILREKFTNNQKGAINNEKI